MIASLNTAYDWAQIAMAAVVVVGGFGAVLGFAARFMWRHMKHEFRAIQKEVTPNGGTTKSAGDTLQRIEKRLADHIEKDAEVQEEIIAALNKLKPRTPRPRRATPK